MNKYKILFLTLKVFSATGGIEKMCRIIGKVLYDAGKSIQIYSMYDNRRQVNTKYFPINIFKGFNKNKISFVLNSIIKGRKAQLIILSHVNLLIVGFIIKKIYPKTKLILLAHGIEIWNSFPHWKNKMLQECDYIIAVSEFTKNKVVQVHRFPEKYCIVMNNSLDPFLKKPIEGEKPEVLLQKYGLQKSDIIVMSVSRLSANERAKGYDKVITALASIIIEYPEIKYLLIGEYDDSEKKRLEKLIMGESMNNAIKCIGFVDESELAEHYKLADIFIMPSKKEGFGIAFIEAMYYRLPVIAGYKDGSRDALCNGELGLLINPDSQSEIINAIKKVINNRENFLPNQSWLMNKFSYQRYSDKWDNLLRTIYEKNRLFENSGIKI